MCIKDGCCFLHFFLSSLFLKTFSSLNLLLFLKKSSTQNEFVVFVFFFFLGNAQSLIKASTQQPLKSLFTSSSADGDRIIVRVAGQIFESRELFVLFVYHLSFFRGGPIGGIC